MVMFRKGVYFREEWLERLRVVLLFKDWYRVNNTYEISRMFTSIGGNVWMNVHW